MADAEPVSSLLFRIRVSRSDGVSRSLIKIFSSPVRSSISNSVGASSFLGRPRSSRRSSLSRMSAAPRRISMCGPSDVDECMGPGMVPTSLLYSVASLDVMRVPDFFSASTTSVAWHIPAMILFLLGNAQTPAGMRSSYSDMSPPPLATISSARPACDLGWITFLSSPDPGIARVCRPVRIAARWAMESIPRASPETMVTGSPASPAMRASQTSLPYGENLRAPTTARSLFPAGGKVPS